eukprot:4987710-Alexandrium_andersonii.AAC.1
MLVIAAIRTNPQSAFLKLRMCFRRSKLERRGPRKDLEMSTRNSRGVRSAQFLAQFPNLPAEAGPEG